MNIEDRIFEKNQLLKKTLARVFAELKLVDNGPIFVNISYSEDDNDNSPYSGLSYATRRRGAGDVPAVIFYGFDNKKRLRKKDEGSILSSEGIFYLQMPFSLSKQLSTMKKALRYGSISKPLDSTTGKSETLRILRLLNHNLPNVIGTIEPNINCLRNADMLTVQNEWSIMRQAFQSAKQHRIEKEITILKGLETFVNRYHLKVYDTILQKLLDADTQYKEVFDILANPHGYTEANKDLVITKGLTMVGTIKNVRAMIERTLNETSSH